MQLNFATQAYQSRSLPVSAQQCINMYAVAAPKDAKAEIPVYGCPGLTLFATCGAGPIYDMRIVVGVLYAVTGSGIWKISAGGAATNVAPFAPAKRPGVSNNDTQILVVDGTNGWVYAPTGIPNTVATTAVGGATTIAVTSIAGMSSGDPISIQLDSGITFATTISSAPSSGNVPLTLPLPSQASAGNQVLDANFTLTSLASNTAFYPANTAAYYDTYFALDRAGTNFFFLSGLDDGTSYNGLDIASAEEDPDIVMSMATIHEQLVIFGAQTTEFWYDVGGSNFPLQPIPGTLLQRGIAAPLAFCKEDNTLFFLGDDLIYYRIVNFAITRVSQDGVEAAWEGYSTTSDAFCFAYTLGGHKFVNVVFPTVGVCWVFDIATGLWHERVSWDANNAPLPRWRGNCAVQAFGMVLIGDAFTGQIGIADYGNYTEYGNTMQALITSPPIHSDNDRVFMSLFEVYPEAGVGLSAGQGSNPQIVLDWSDDGGRTFGPTQLFRSLGEIGQYKQRVRWTKLGQFRNRVLRLTITDPVKRALIGFYADLKVGMK
jgi:hypothetical protein